MSRRWIRRLRKILAYGTLLAALLVICGIIYEKIGERRDRTRYARIGQPVDIGGRSLNLFCSGAGSPVVILDSGGHTAGYSWIDIQPRIAQFTRACWFDRAGYGWSDPAPSPRTFAATAADLHALLNAAGVPGPYVLVGATASSFHVRVYKGLYPGEVAGAVLIHASDPDIFAHEPEFMKNPMDSWPAWIKTAGCSFAGPAMARIGLLRLLGNPGAGRPFGMDWLNPAQQQELRFLSNNPSTANTEGEGCSLNQSMRQVNAAGNLGARPLRVLVNSAPFPSPGPQYDQATANLNDFWFHQLQPRLAALSTGGKLVAGDKAESADSVVANVREVVGEVRATEQQATRPDR